MKKFLETVAYTFVECEENYIYQNFEVKASALRTKTAWKEKP
jgi:hypothetical protein